MKILLSLVLALASTANAFAYSSENVGPVLAKYNLEGSTWRGICTFPIENSNEEFDFVKEKNGTVLAVRTPVVVLLFYILDAEPHGRRFVKLRVRAEQVTKPGLQTLILEVGEDALRIYSNIADSGEKYIEDGLHARNRTPIPFSSRCS